MTDSKSPLQLILERNSASKLTEPGPNPEEIQTLLQAAARAPDHARLKPWRFLLIEGEGREALGKLFAEVQQANAEGALSDEKLADIASKTLRAPLIIAAIVNVQEHPKVPEIEQVMSVACACQNMLLAAEAIGYAGIWRTGPMAFDPAVHQGLGLADNEQLLGYLYFGTRAAKAKDLPDVDLTALAKHWP